MDDETKSDVDTGDKIDAGTKIETVETKTETKSDAAYTADDLKKAVADALAADRAEKERAENEKQGKYEKLYNDAKATITQLQSEIAELKLVRTREVIGRKHNLPDELIGRLRGADETEINADAKKVADALKKSGVDTTQTGDGTPGGGGDNTGNASRDNKKQRESLASTGAYSL